MSPWLLLALPDDRKHCHSHHHNSNHHSICFFQGWRHTFCLEGPWKLTLDPCRAQLLSDPSPRLAIEQMKKGAGTSRYCLLRLWTALSNNKRSPRRMIWIFLKEIRYHRRGRSCSLPSTRNCPDSNRGNFEKRPVITPLSHMARGCLWHCKDRCFSRKTKYYFSELLSRHFLNKTQLRIFAQIAK